MTAEVKNYIDERFNRLEALTLIGSKATLTAEEAALYTGYTLKGIYEFTSQKKIPHYKKNGRLYFKKTELDEWLTENRIKTNKEIDIEATTYVTTH